jgi:hypothetical protein
LACNQHRKIAYWSLANSFITIAVSIIVARRFSFWGVASAGLVGDIVCGAVVFPYLAARFMDCPMGRFYEAMMTPILITIPTCVILFICRKHLSEWMFLGVGVVIGLILIYGGTRFALGKGEESAWVLERLKGRWRNLL